MKNTVSQLPVGGEMWRTTCTWIKFIAVNHQKFFCFKSCLTYFFKTNDDEWLPATSHLCKMENEIRGNVRNCIKHSRKERYLEVKIRGVDFTFELHFPMFYELCFQSNVLMSRYWSQNQTVKILPNKHKMFEM